MNRNRIYTNGEITIYWQASECIHKTTCYTKLRSVFDPLKRPWVNPNGAKSERIKEIIEECPTTALTFRWNDEIRNARETSPKLFKGSLDIFSDKSQPQPQLTTVTIRPNGPILISGNFRVIDTDGTEMRSMQMMSMCRCWLSSNQPYCDGTHFKANFTD